jgi:hypothetical protein
MTPMTTSGDFTYLSDGTVRLDMSDGTSTLLSDTGEDAVVLSQTMPDGTVYSQFDGEHPGHVQYPDGSSGDFSYLPDGTVELDLSDGASVLLSGTGEDAVVLSQTMPDGTVYSQFDGEHPGHVQYPDGSWGDFSYLSDGTVRLDLSDGTHTLLSGTGEDAVVLSQTTADGAVYTGFDDLGRPHHVEFAGHH